nr:hypothetical protein [uncultured Microbacterium sp.]
MSYTSPAPTRDTRSSTLSIVSLALAIVLPPIGVVLGLIARARSKAAGSPTLVATAAAVVGAILSVLWAVMIVTLLTVGSSLLSGEEAPDSPGATSSPSDAPTQAPDPGSATGETITLTMTAERAIDESTLDAARTALAYYGQAADLGTVDIVTADDGSIQVTFDEDVAAADIDAFMRGASSPAAEGFFAVTALHQAGGGADLGGGSTTPPCDALRFGPLAVSDAVVACDQSTPAQLLLAPSPRFVGESITEVEAGGDVVAVTLNGANAEEFADWTREVSLAPAPTNQIALVDFIGVIGAPVVSDAITGGEFQVSGASLDVDLLAARLSLLSAGASFEAG